MLSLVCIGVDYTYQKYRPIIIIPYSTLAICELISVYLKNWGIGVGILFGAEP